MGRRPDPDRLRSVLLVLVPGAAAVYLAFRGGGTAAGLAALVAIACLAALLWRAAPGTVDANVASSTAAAAVLALPGLLTVYFAFNAGGFFPETPAFVAVVLILILVVRVTTADDPLAGLGWPVAVAAGALALLCLWTLMSGSWSDAPARALIEFDRAFVYLLALVLFGSMPRSSSSLRWMVRGVALGIVAVAVAGVLSRTLPDVFPTEPPLFVDRLGFPLTYWNGVGILSSIGAILCLHLTSSLREPLAIRALAAASLPVLGVAVLLTFSRGAIACGVLGLVAYVVLGRPRGLVTGLVAALPLAVLALKGAYDATALASQNPTGPAAVDEGHDLALLMAACCVGAGLVRLALAPADSRLRGFALPTEMRRRVVWGGLAAVLVAGIVASAVLDAPGRVADQYETFVEKPENKRDGPTRERLGNLANSGRLDHWEIALDAYRGDKLRGQGAGTYSLRWTRERPGTEVVVDDAHSLYVEMLGELGVIGALLIVIVVVAILAGFAGIRRGRDRTLHAVLLAAGGAWAVHAGIDWDWEMPAVTSWVFCLGGAALAGRGARASARAGPPSGVRVVLGTVLLIGAIAPALLLVSQRQLDDAADAFEQGDCTTAAERATASIRTLEIRPEPYEVLGFCHVQQGFDRLGAAAMEEAVERDPDNWEFQYGLAVVRGSAGLDPRPAAQKALQQNPNDKLTKSLVGYVNTSDPRRWIAKTRPIAENERLSVVD
jgi:hypothetical protein